MLKKRDLMMGCLLLSAKFLLPVFNYVQKMAYE